MSVVSRLSRYVPGSVRQVYMDLLIHAADVILLEVL